MIADTNWHVTDATEEPGWSVTRADLDEGSRHEVTLVRHTRTVRLDRVVVREGQTLSGVARLHGTTVRRLVELNGISDPDVIRVGQSIRIPR